MRSIIKTFSASEVHKHVDSAVVIILSHGKSGDLIYGTDAETVSMERILKCFNNENCPALLNRPKMFFVQACRGGKHLITISCYKFDEEIISFASADAIYNASINLANAIYSL